MRSCVVAKSFRVPPRKSRAVQFRAFTNPSVTLLTLEKVAQALGCRVKIDLVPI